MNFTPLSQVFLSIWPINFHYYGLMYAISFLIAYIFLRKLIRDTKMDISDREYESMFFWIIIWWLVWWRLWHILFYEAAYFFSNPLEILAVWKWWMASHWWLIWGLIAFFIVKPRRINTLWLLDLIVIPLPIGLALWRIWNLINWELYWKVSSLSWCMEFHDSVCRHPTQIYAVLKNLFIFFAIYFLYKTFYSQLKKWFLLSIFLIEYWTLRIFVEFFKEDFSWNNYFDIITTWQILSAIMILLWISLLFLVNKKELNKV